MKNAGKACNNRLYRHIRTFEKIVKNYFVIYEKYHLIFKKAEVTIMEFKSILIKDTTVEERKQIVKESLGNISASCDGCMARLSEMYDEYIEGKKEIRDINMEFNGHYLRGDMDKGEKRSCPM